MEASYDAHLKEMRLLLGRWSHQRKASEHHSTNVYQNVRENSSGTASRLISTRFRGSSVFLHMALSWFFFS
jgi:hypothetical protein